MCVLSLQPHGLGPLGACGDRAEADPRSLVARFALPASARTWPSTVAVMAKPALLHLSHVPMDPELQKDFEDRFQHHYLWEEKEKANFFKETGSAIKGIVTDTKGKINEELLQKLPNLEIVSTFSVGLDHVDLPLCKKLGVFVTNTPDVLTDCTADTALALLIACLRQIPQGDRYVREGRWPIEGEFPVSTKVSGKRVGVVGLGRIGAAIARRCEGFGCQISYYSRVRKTEYPNYNHCSSVVTLAGCSDVLIVACALTKETTRIINREVLDALGPHGFVVNIARGLAIDEAELVKALVEKRLAGAGLDVFENEPHVPKELLSMDNVVLLPHLGSATLETRDAMAQLVVSNLVAHFSGQSLLTPVDMNLVLVS